VWAGADGRVDHRDTCTITAAIAIAVTIAVAVTTAVAVAVGSCTSVRSVVPVSTAVRATAITSANGGALGPAVTHHWHIN
jgi:hypothetical protein